MPSLHRELAGDQRRARAIAILDDFHQVAPLVGGEPVRAPVVEDQQIGLGEGAEEARKAAIAVRRPLRARATLIAFRGHRGRGHWSGGPGEVASLWADITPAARTLQPGSAAKAPAPARRMALEKKARGVVGAAPGK